MHQDPLYPYLLALLYALGGDFTWMFLLQRAAGVGSNVLIYLLACRYFDDLVAAVAGLLGVLCSPLLFYELVLLRETFIVFAGLGLVYLFEAARTWDRASGWGLFGLAVGLAVLLKSIFLPVGALLVLGLAWPLRRSPRNWLRAALGTSLGCLLALSPLVARNLILGVPPVKLAGSGAVSFIGSNAADVPSTFLVGALYSRHIPRIMGETEGAFLPAIVKTLQTHESFWSYWVLATGKFTTLWSWYETPDNCSFYFYQLHSGVLRYLPVTFLVLSPLALVGLVLALLRENRCWPLLLYVLALTALMLVFYPMSRYRLPLVAALIPFAALSAVRIPQWLTTAGQRRTGLLCLLVLPLIAFWTSEPLPQGMPRERLPEFIVAYLNYYLPMLERAEQENDAQTVLAVGAEILRVEPARTRQLGRNEKTWLRWEAEFAHQFAVVRYRYARALEATGQVEEAREQKQRADELREATVTPFTE